MRMPDSFKLFGSVTHNGEPTNLVFFLFGLIIFDNKSRLGEKKLRRTNPQFFHAELSQTTHLISHVETVVPDPLVSSVYGLTGSE